MVFCGYSGFAGVDCGKSGFIWDAILRYIIQDLLLGWYTVWSFRLCWGGIRFDNAGFAVVVWCSNLGFAVVVYV